MTSKSCCVNKNMHEESTWKLSWFGLVAARNLIGLFDQSQSKYSSACRTNKCLAAFFYVTFNPYQKNEKNKINKEASCVINKWTQTCKTLAPWEALYLWKVLYIWGLIDWKKKPKVCPTSHTANLARRRPRPTRTEDDVMYVYSASLHQPDF